LTYTYICIKERRNKIVPHILSLSVNKIVKEEKKKLIVKASFLGFLEEPDNLIIGKIEQC